MTEHIQINDVAPRVQYLADGVQSAFTFPFAIFADGDLEVWLDDALQTGGYAVSGAGISTGGTALFSQPPSTGARVTLRRRLPIRRTTDYQSDGLIRAKTLNDEMDYQVAALQQVAEELNRSLRRSATSADTVDMILPTPLAGRGLKWNSSGTALVNTTNDPDAIGDATAAAAAAQAAAQIASEVAAQVQDAVGGVRTDATDTSLAPLADKLVAGAGISVTVQDDLGAKSLVIASSSPGDLTARLDFLERNLALNTLRDQIDAGWSVLDMVGGIADEYEDTNGLPIGWPAKDGDTAWVIKANGAHGSGSFTDPAGGYGLTVSGATVNTTLSKFGGGSADFGSTANAYEITASYAGGWGQMNADFTMDGWIYPRSASDYIPIARQTNGDGGSLGWIWHLAANGTTMYLYVNGNLSAAVLTVPSAYWNGGSPFNNWQHVAISRLGSTGYGFVNGRLLGTFTFPSLNTTTNNIAIGRGGSYGGGAWLAHATANGCLDGCIEDFRLSKICRYTKDFTLLNKGLGVTSAGFSGFVYEAKSSSLGLTEYISLVPKLTANTGQGWTITTNSTNGSWSATFNQYALFDGDPANGAYYSASPAVIWEIIPPSPLVVGSYSILGSGQGAREMKTWTFDGWNGSSWVTLDSRSNVTSWGILGFEKHFAVATPGSYQKYRFNVTANNGDTQYTAPGGILLFPGSSQTVSDGVVTSEAFDTNTVGEPLTVRILALLEEIDTIALNSDLVVSVSLDGGTSWSTGTLAEDGDFDARTKVISAVIDVSGQSGTTAIYRFNTYGRRCRLHGVWMQWR